MRLSWRIARFMLATVLLANLLSLGVVAWSVRQAVEEGLAQELGTSRETLAERIAQERRVLEATTRALATEPMMRAVLGTDDVDAATLAQVTEASRVGLQLDALLLVGPRGEVLAASPESARPDGAVAEGAQAFVLGDDCVYVGWSERVWVGGVVVGSVLGAHRVDERLLGAVARETGTELVLRSGGRAIARTASAPADVIAAQDYPSGEIVPISAGKELLVTAASLGEGVDVVLISDRGAAFERFRGTLARLALVGLASLLLAGMLSIAFARGVTKPLQRVTTAASRIAAGDLSYATVRELPEADASSEDEAVRLATTFREMVAELRRSRGDLERHAIALQAEVQKAKAADHAKSAFLANMSHELRTPLNAIIGYSEMLAEDAKDRRDAQSTEDLHRIRGAGSQLLTLINAVLDLSKIQAGRMELFFEDVDVAAIVNEAANTLGPMAQKRNVRLEVSCPPDVGLLRADAVKLRQVLLNLLSNACKFTENGQVTFRVQVAEDHVVFEVQDSGIGMDARQLGNLFQEFFQGDTSTTRKYGGTGLGLAISQRFVQMMGGVITVESAPGQGSTFRARMPRVIRRVPASDPSSITDATVLVVDDDEDVRDLIVRMLAKEGYRALPVHSGAELLSLARQTAPAAITLDVRMADMDGWQVLEQLKAEPRLAHIPVVMISITDEAERACALGADAFLTKPVDRAQLRDALARHAPR